MMAVRKYNVIKAMEEDRGPSYQYKYLTLDEEKVEIMAMLMMMVMMTMEVNSFNCVRDDNICIQCVGHLTLC